MDISKVKLDISWTYHQSFINCLYSRLGHIRHIRLKKSKSLENYKNVFSIKFWQVFGKNEKKRVFNRGRLNHLSNMSDMSNTNN